jgi:hypothetical protein
MGVGLATLRCRIGVPLPFKMPGDELVSLFGDIVGVEMSCLPKRE